MLRTSFPNLNDAPISRCMLVFLGFLLSFYEEIWITGVEILGLPEVVTMEMKYSSAIKVLHRPQQVHCCIVIQIYYRKCDACTYIPI